MFVSIQPDFPFLLPLQPCADMQICYVLDPVVRQELSMQDGKIAQVRGRQFVQALGRKRNPQERGKFPFEAFFSHILQLPDTAENQLIFSKITEAFFKQEGYLKRLFSGESWEEWTENRTALGRVVSQLRDCAQSQTQVKHCLQKLDGRVVQKANEEAAILLKGLHRPDGSMNTYLQPKGSCVRGFVGGVVASLAFKNPFPLVLGLSGCLSRVSAQQKIGAEFQINTYTIEDQKRPSVATFTNGNFVVTWDSWTQDSNNSRGVFGQLFNESGTKIGAEFQVNNYTTSNQDTPSVTSFPNGNFVVAWESLYQDGSMNGVYGQLFNGMGTKIGNEFLINTYTTHEQKYPSVESLNNGNFVVIWQGYFQDSNNSFGVYGQMFTGDATKIGSELQVNNYTTNNQRYPDVASFPNGNFVVTWESDGQDGSFDGVYGQLFNENGTKIGSEFQVNNYTAHDQDTPSLTSFPNGNFVVTWESDGQDGSDSGVFGQLFNGIGTKIGNEFQVNTYTTGTQRTHSVASFSNGNFVVTWSSFGQDGNRYGIYGQLFDGNANKIGNEFQVNTYTCDIQESPSVAGFGNGNFVVTWESDEQDGSSRGIFGQIFRDIVIFPSSTSTTSTFPVTSDTTSKVPSQVGSEFQINTNTIDDQKRPSVATFTNGNFVVTWDSWAQDTNNSRGVYGQLFNESGTKIGAEFQVNNYTTSNQDTPSVTSLSNGNFVVVWESVYQDGSADGVYGQLFNGMGTKIGNELLINTYTTHEQEYPSVESLNNGNFVVIWQGYFQDSNNSFGVYGQMFTGDATTIGAEFQVNNYTANNQIYPDVASFPNGNFVVTWESQNQDSNNSRGVYGQLFNESGTKIGAEFQVNNYTVADQDCSSVTSLSNGNFIVTWESLYQDGSLNGVYGQLFDGNGTKIGAEFQVNTYTASHQEIPSVTSLSNGNFIVTWESLYQDGSLNGVYGQLFNANGTKIGAEFQVNTYTCDIQGAPSVASFGNGNFIVTWESDEQDGSSRGIFGQIFHDNVIFPFSTSTTSTFPVTSDSTSKLSSTSPNRNNNLFWLVFLLGGASVVACFALTGYLFFKSRHRKEGNDGVELSNNDQSSDNSTAETQYQRTPDFVTERAGEGPIYGRTPDFVTEQAGEGPIYGRTPDFVTEEDGGVH